jgi:hypothetical protein
MTIQSVPFSQQDKGCYFSFVGFWVFCIRIRIYSLFLYLFINSYRYYLESILLLYTTKWKELHGNTEKTAKILGQSMLSKD